MSGIERLPETVHLHVPNVTIEIDSDLFAKLEAEGRKNGQRPEDVARRALEVLNHNFELNVYLESVDTSAPDRPNY